MSDAVLDRVAEGVSAKATPTRGYFNNPWRKPRILQGVTIAYLLWSLLPVVIAIIFSFNSGRSRSSWQGFSLRWWNGDPFNSLFHDEALRAAMFQTFRLSIPTAIVAVALGTLFAIGIDRWHGRPARGANFVMLLSFVLPEMILGVSLFLVFTYLFNELMTLGTGAQWLGLITFQMSYAVVIVRARLLTIGPEYEEAAMDLGAKPGQSMRRVLLPLLWPAILASVAVVFADTVDDFVIVRFLSGSADSEPLSVKIYSAARGSPTPAVNAAATVMLLSTMTVIAIGYLLYRRFSKDLQGADVGSFTQV
jgi:spermidine/putrescine transport system permease protein